MPWSKGSCAGKVGIRSCLVQMYSGSIYRRNRRFIKQDKSKDESAQIDPVMDVPDLPIILEDKDLEQTSVDSIKQTRVDSKMTPQPDQDISIPERYTRSGRKVQIPNTFKDFVI